MGLGATLIVVLAWLLAGLLGALLTSAPIVMADSRITAALREAASPDMLDALSCGGSPAPRDTRWRGCLRVGAVFHPMALNELRWKPGAA